MLTLLFSLSVALSYVNILVETKVDFINQTLSNNTQQTELQLTIDSYTPDSFMLTNLNFVIKNCETLCFMQSSFQAHATEDFLGKVTFLNKKYPSETLPQYSARESALTSISNTEDTTTNIDANGWIGTEKTFSGQTLSSQKKNEIFGQQKEEREKLLGANEISIVQFPKTYTEKQISWNIEKLGVFLSNKSQPTTITIIHPDKPTHLRVEYISKMDSFEGKTNIIPCPNEQQDGCSFLAPVDILKKSKEILVTIEK